MESFLVNVADVAPLDAGKASPNGVTRFLGRDSGPWVFYSERPAGAVIPMHRHRSDRTEFLVEGEIRFRFAEPPVDGSPQEATYGAGSMSFVRAETAYGYEVTQDAKILLVFAEEPGMSYL